MSSGPELDAGAEIGVHGALRVRCDKDEAARRRRPLGRGRRREAHADRAQIVREDPAEPIVPHLADIGAAAAQGRDPGDGVGDRTARHLDAGPHLAIERFGARRIDERRGALDQALRRKKTVIGAGQHVDHGVADAEHVDLGSGHFFSSGGGKRGARV